MFWGKAKENGIWIAKCSRFRVLIGGADRLIYAHLGRFGFRLMNPLRP